MPQTRSFTVAGGGGEGSVGSVIEPIIVRVRNRSSRPSLEHDDTLRGQPKGIGDAIKAEYHVAAGPTLPRWSLRAIDAIAKRLS